MKIRIAAPMLAALLGLGLQASAAWAQSTPGLSQFDLSGTRTTSPAPRAKPLPKPAAKPNAEKLPAVEAGSDDEIELTGAHVIRSEEVKGEYLQTGVTRGPRDPLAPAADPVIWKPGTAYQQPPVYQPVPAYRKQPVVPAGHTNSKGSHVIPGECSTCAPAAPAAGCSTCGECDEFSPLMEELFDPCWNGRRLGEGKFPFYDCDDGGWIFGGWLQQSFVGNFDSPSNRSNAPFIAESLGADNSFGLRSNAYQMNQLYLFAGRQVVATGDNWDLGGRVDLLYGADHQFVQGRGFELADDGQNQWNGQDQHYGLAIPQAYVEAALPGLQGTTVKAGRFYTIMGLEDVRATENFFFTRSYQFLYGQPFTHTGVLVNSQISDNIVIQGGLTSGFDDVDPVDNKTGFLGGIRWMSTNRRTALALTVHTGDEDTQFGLGNGRVAQGRQTLIMGVFERFLTERLLLQLSGQFSVQDDAVLDVDVPGQTQVLGSSAQYYGVNQQLLWFLNDRWAVGQRFEWFRDEDGTRIGQPIQFENVPLGAPTELLSGGNFYQLAFGVNYTPTRNVRMRTEARWDWSDQRGTGAPGFPTSFRPFNDGTAGDQLLWAADLIISY